MSPRGRIISNHSVFLEAKRVFDFPGALVKNDAMTLFTKMALRATEYLYRRRRFTLYRTCYFAYKTVVDADENRLIRKTVKPGMVVVDIGANVGFYSRMVSDLVGPEGKVHCFEPDTLTFLHLKKTLRAAANVVLRPMAVADRSGVLTLYESSDLNSDHVTFPIEGRRTRSGIESVSLDDYFPTGGKVDFIKMDIQGFEPRVWQGMKRLVAENPGLVVVSEFYPEGLRRAGSDPDAYLELIRSFGFRAFALKGKTLEEMTAKQVRACRRKYWTMIAIRNVPPAAVR